MQVFRHKIFTWADTRLPLVLQEDYALLHRPDKWADVQSYCAQCPSRTKLLSSGAHPATDALTTSFEAGVNDNITAGQPLEASGSEAPKEVPPHLWHALITDFVTEIHDR